MSGPTAVLDASILVVDDQEADARLIEAMLSGAGFHSITLTHDPTAVARLHAAQRYELVILDLLMPRMDGFEVLAQLQAIDPELPVPVIAVTAESEHMTRALEAGARDFISKPIRRAELLSRTRNALDLGRLMREQRSQRVRAQELLVEAESHYRALVEQSLVGIFLNDPQNRLLYANPRLCEIVGYGFDELVGRDLNELTLEDDRRRVVELRRQRAAGKIRTLVNDSRMRRKDGKIVNVSVESKLIDLVGGKATLGMVQDITLRVHAQELLEHANERLRVLSRRVLDVQEEERRGISRELHDDVGQSLLALNIGLHRLENRLPADQRDLLDECIAVAADVRDKLRELSVQLHPPHLDQLGLQDALRWLVGRQHEMTGVHIECTLTGVDGVHLPPAVESACYRICQEAVTNATRHASAKAISVELTLRQGQLELVVRDDGVGFDPQAKREALLTAGSLGLISMEERARLAGGRFELSSVPGAGTRVAATFPIGAREHNGARAREKA